jgi:outer membrane immunogenic protein
MKKFLLASVALVALGSSASAADMAARPYTKAPPPMVAAMYDWSGFYIGGNGGWGQQRDCRFNVTVAFDIGCHDADGAVAGGQIGYRWQSSAWVFGLEAQGDWADLKGTHLNPTGLNNVHSRLDAFGLFTGQVGYAWNNALLYVKGGAAVVSHRFDFLALGTNALLASTGDQTRWGATAGVGLEYGFAPNWSFAVEYDHIFTDRHNTTFVTPAGVPLVATYRSGGDVDLITARINYRFGWGGGPAVARY